MKRGGLITLTSRGLFCKQGDFYIDPWKPVPKAVVTHAHADHTYRGNQDYLVPAEGALLSRIRLGDEAQISTQSYGEVANINGVSVSFHPAGHVLGSAQVRVDGSRPGRSLNRSIRGGDGTSRKGRCR
jgi:putative mRNA 3-end processing factor